MAKRTDSSTPEYIVDASNPNRIRVWARADVFADIARTADLNERLAGAELAVQRLAKLRKRAA